MNSHARTIDHQIQSILNAPGGDAEDTAASGNENRYRQVGQKYRTVPAVQAPLLQFMIVLTNGNTIEFKYAYVTERYFTRSDPTSNKNAILVRIRDAIQISIAGYNLAQLNEDLLRQAVLDLGSVGELETAAALKADPNQTVITSVSVEHGRMDIENGLWLPGSGTWSDSQQRWIPGVQKPNPGNSIAVENR